MEISKVLRVERGIEDCRAGWVSESLAWRVYMIERQDMRSRERTEQRKRLDSWNTIYWCVTYA